MQGVRHYGTPSNHSITELIRAMRKVERRLDALEGKSRDKPVVEEVLKYEHCTVLNIYALMLLLCLL